MERPNCSLGSQEFSLEESSRLEVVLPHIWRTIRVKNTIHTHLFQHLVYAVQAYHNNDRSFLPLLFNYLEWSSSLTSSKLDCIMYYLTVHHAHCHVIKLCSVVFIVYATLNHSLCNLINLCEFFPYRITPGH
jgi:hypothetical protein